MEQVRLGIIGCGERAATLAKTLFAGGLNEYRVTAACDVIPSRAQEMNAVCGGDARVFTDWREMIAAGGVDAMLVATGWEEHFPIVLECLRAGIPVGAEVGGAYSLEQCWQLVHGVEATGTKFMFLENCCYGRTELLCMNMAHQGLFGDVVHCTGAYLHDLRRLISEGEFRLKNHVGRNCDNYPTHDLGPICKLLGINKSNRMLTVTSVSSGAFGLNAYARNNVRYAQNALTRFAQGDMVNTLIKCAGGQTIALRNCTTLPLPYSRDFGVYGTDGSYANERFFFQDKKTAEAKGEQGGPLPEAEFYEKYDHPLWQRFLAEGAVGGHGGMDGLVFKAFASYVRDEISCPVDVYDAASWMAVSVLSEQSAALGGTPQPMPDFTCGK